MKYIKLSTFSEKSDNTGIKMEDNFRNALIILSGVVIAAIFIHGLWTIRKQKNPYKLKASKKLVKPLSRDFDRKGFDQDGVGKIKVLKPVDGSDVIGDGNLAQRMSLREISHLDDEQRDDSCSELSLQKSLQEKVNVHVLNTSMDTNEIINEESQEEEIKLAPIYQQPVTQAKPASNKVTCNQIASKEIRKESTSPVQIDDIDSTSPQPSSAQNALKHNPIEPQIIMLSVVMPANQLMSGAVLLPTLLTLGLKFGEMNIFHRHQDNAGNGAVTFSLANMLNPGSFDLETMETFATQGVSLFMTLPNAGESFAAFEQMLAAAKQLAQEFNAQLLDDKRNVMTKQTEQHYIGKIRAFDRQHHLASA